MEKMNITINGYPYTVSSKETILEICKKNHIFIPTFCHDERFTSDGSCRMCVVEVNGEKILQTSCTLYPQENMVINTLTEDVVIARKEILNMLWSKHTGECMTCDSKGNCRLEDYIEKFEIPKEKQYKRKAKSVSQDENEYFDFDSNKCILCYKCLNICSTFEKGKAIALSGEKNNPNITFNFEEGKDYSFCLTCGECVDICPTGAITPKSK